MLNAEFHIKKAELKKTEYGISEKKEYLLGYVEIEMFKTCFLSKIQILKHSYYLELIHMLSF